MSGSRDSDYFMNHMDEYEALTEEDRTKLLVNGVLEGDTKADETETEVDGSAKTEETAAAPAAAAKVDDAGKSEEEVLEKKEEHAEADLEPVIASKDGKHTIPYSELTAAREDATNWKQQAQEANALLGQFKEAKEADKGTGDTAAQDEVLKNLQEQFPELAEELLPAIKGLVKAGVEESVKALESKLDGIVKPLQENAQESAAQAHFKAIEEAHPGYDKLVESKEFTDWIDKQPSFMKTEFNRVLDKGTTPQVIELFTAYKNANPAKATETVTLSAEQIKQNADKKVADAKPAVPASLSDIPAGGQNHHDEGAAMHELNPLQLMSKFEGKTPAQIEALMKKAL